jgi:hypothetical protein
LGNSFGIRAQRISVGIDNDEIQLCHRLLYFSCEYDVVIPGVVLVAAYLTRPFRWEGRVAKL